jgi:hypothetical protein
VYEREREREREGKSVGALLVSVMNVKNTGDI